MKNCMNKIIKYLCTLSHATIEFNLYENRGTPSNDNISINVHDELSELANFSTRLLRISSCPSVGTLALPSVGVELLDKVAELENENY